MATGNNNNNKKEAHSEKFNGSPLRYTKLYQFGQSRVKERSMQWIVSRLLFCCCCHFLFNINFGNYLI